MSDKTEAQQLSVVELKLQSFKYSQAKHPIFLDLELTLRPGTLTVITGGSGSGKSTLGAILAGLLPRPGLDRLEAKFVVDGQTVEYTALSSPRIDPSAWAQHIGFLPQDPGEYLSGIRETVKEELVFSMENRGILREMMEERLQSVSELFDIAHLLNRDPTRLSGGQERLVALAALVINDPQVLVLDEPLAGLDSAVREAVLNAIRRLTALEKTVVFLSRDSGKLPMSAHDVFYIRENKLESGTLTGLPQEIDYAWPRLGDCPEQTGEVLLSFQRVSLGYGKNTAAIVENFNLNLHAGEYVALIGPNGSGKTTLLKAAASLIKPVSGSILLYGKVGLLLQNPNDQLFERTVFKEVGYGLSNSRKTRNRIGKVLEQAGLNEFAKTHPYELPTAKRRLVALASVLVHEPEILLLDEPFEGLDYECITELRSLFARLLQGRFSILQTSHHKFQGLKSSNGIAGYSIV